MIYSFFLTVHVRHETFSFYCSTKSDEKVDTDLIYFLLAEGKGMPYTQQISIVRSYEIWTMSIVMVGIIFVSHDQKQR